jgi:hypothetical protein
MPRKKIQSFVGGIAYDGYKKNWSVAESVCHNGLVTQVNHRRRPMHVVRASACPARRPAFEPV